MTYPHLSPEAGDMNIMGILTLVFLTDVQIYGCVGFICFGHVAL